MPPTSTTTTTTSSTTSSGGGGGAGPGRLLAHAYPWDVLGDGAFVERALALGLDAVALAASYHSTRAATPWHPAHQLVEAPHAALYRPVREEAWAGAPLRPVAGTVPDGTADAFAEAAGRLREAGLEVDAWTVLAHSTRLGTQHPDLAVVNCFGDRYSYALCPSAAEVRGYCATLAAEAVRAAPVTGALLEALGTMGVTHNAAHEKTAGAFGPALERVLSVCCCGRCREGWAQHGQDPGAVVRRCAAACATCRTPSPATCARSPTWSANRSRPRCWRCGTAPRTRCARRCSRPSAPPPRSRCG